LIHGELESSTIARFDQRDTGVTTDLYSGFLQDKIQLVDDELFLTLGSKFEYNSFTEFEIQPNARLAWLPTDNQTVWASVSRSVRTPSIIDSSLTQAVAGSAVTPGLGFPGGYVAIQSNDQFKSEEMIAYELGYRIQPSESVSLDLTGFYNDYDRLRTFEQAAGGPDADIFVNLLADNKAQGKTTGFEAAMNWEVLDNWTLGGSYSYLDMDIKLDNNSTDTIGVSEDGRSPNNMFNIRSHYAFAPDWELDNAVYYVDSIDGSAADAHDVEGYVRMDAKLTYRPADGIETSLVGQNLLDKTHQEYGSATYSSPYEIPRTVYGKVSFSF